jgi:hypothetical protein
LLRAFPLDHVLNFQRFPSRRTSAGRTGPSLRPKYATSVVLKLRRRFFLLVFGGMLCNWKKSEPLLPFQSLYTYPLFTKLRHFVTPE